jgi:V/A-type H+-transporting ATPase subunit I
MSIVQVQKATLLASMRGKAALMEALQEFGEVHLIPLSEGGGSRVPYPERVAQALRWLSKSPEQSSQYRHRDDFDIDQIVTETEDVQQRILSLRDRLEVVQDRIAHLSPWGSFEFPPAEEIGGYRFWFYRVPHKLMDQVAATDLVWSVVHDGRNESYVVVISRNQPDADAMPVPRVRAGGDSLFHLERERERIELELEDCRFERLRLTRWINNIRQHIADYRDREALGQACRETLEDGEFFLAQCWVPVSKLEDLHEVAKQAHAALYLEEPQHDEMPPTVLANRPVLAAGENLVQFYQVPNYWGWDSSATVFVSFCLFFAMILADAGYAALLGLGLAYYWKRMGSSETGLRFRRLLFWLVTTSFVYGVAAGSFFGVTPNFALFKTLHVLDIKNFNTMIAVVVYIGVFHLVMANSVAAWVHGLRWQSLAQLGWILILLGGTGYWMVRGHSHIPLYVIAAGAGLILLFSSERPLRGVRNLVMRLVDGLVDLFHLSKAFGDTLSYMRLMALGLAGATMADTFNGLAGDMIHHPSGLSVAAGILVLLFGHILNIILGIVGGVVHGLRLNFIEFLSWTHAEEGHVFQPFRKTSYFKE